jgi:flavin-dependent dehydrogenase
VVTFDGGSRAGAEVLIAADGANGICGRSLQLGEGRIFAPALEANVAYEAVGAGVEQHVALLEMGYVPGGYGWLFPKGDHANVGVGGWDSEGPRLRDHLRLLCERHGIAFSSLTEIRGHRLPMRGAATRVARGRALAVGDAAGLVDPLSGDGMYEAFSSAHVATACVREVLEGRTTDLSAYPARLDAALGRHTSLAWIAKAAIERTPASRCASRARMRSAGLPAAHRDESRPAHGALRTRVATCRAGGAACWGPRQLNLYLR